MNKSMKLISYCVLLLIVVLECSCSSVRYEGIRKGEFIDQEATSTNCLLETKTKIEIIDNDFPDKVRIFKEESYGDKLRKKYKSEGFKNVEHKPVAKIALSKILPLIGTGGLVLFLKSFYTDSWTSASSDYSEETWIIEDQYQFSDATEYKYTKQIPYDGSISVAVYDRRPKDLSQVSYPSDQIVLNDTIYASDKVAKVDLCRILQDEDISEYQIRFQADGAYLDASIKSSDLAKRCHKSRSEKIDKIIKRHKMPEPPK